MKKVQLLLLLLIVCFGPAKAQLVADFVADTLSFCPPRTVRFTDLSTGNITSRSWQFSPTQSSNTNNPFPIATYTSPGTYNVSLTISDGVNTVTRTKTAYIKVFQPPRADFVISGNRSACAPLPVQITDLTTPGDAPISWYRYTLGDGSTSQQPSPNYTYNSGGLFTLTLQVIDTNACQASKTRQSYVEVFSKPKADFSTVGPPHNCQAPHAVDFRNLSRGNAPFQYLWDFGDGNSSTSSSPTNIYGAGVFTVSLSIRDRNGCRDTLVKPAYVSATSTRASFTIPDTICVLDSVAIVNTSVGGSNYQWDFGDGTSSTDRDVVKAYASTGWYRIKLSTSSGPNCFDSISKRVYVERVEAAFSHDKVFSCKAQQVNYTNLSTGSHLNSWLWKFSNGDTSHARNTSTNYQDPGFYDAKLIVSNVRGCKDSIIKLGHFNISVINPIIDNDIDSGCAPLTVLFTDRSTPQDSILSREWDWGDGSALDSLPQLTHTFTNPGVYAVKLSVVSKSGCTYTRIKRIIVGTKQNANFVIDKDSICAGDGVQITNISTDSTLINSYHWFFSDGGEYLGKDPDPYQPLDTGLLNVTLVVEYNGCFDTTVQNNVIFVKGPIGQMNVGVNCNVPYELAVTGVAWKEVQRFKWDLGDFIGYDSTRQSFNYRYQGRGFYRVTMTLYNDSNGCEYSKNQFIQIYDLKVALSVDDSVFCIPQELNLSAFGSQDASLLTYTNLSTGKDSLTNQWSVPMKSNTKGYHNFRLIGMDPLGCLDTAYVRVRGFKPEARFVVSDTLGCFPMTTTFRDRSLSDTTIRSYRWFLGAGIQGSDSVETVRYPLKGNFGVQLQVEDALGCRDTVTAPQLIDIRQPTIYFNPDSTLCAGDSVSLKNLNHQRDYRYLWSAPGNMSRDSATRFGFPNGGMQPIQAIVTDSLGCTDTMIRIMNVQHIPNARIQASLTDTNCYPALVRFEDITNHPNIEWRTWSFGLGDPPVTRRNKTAAYTYPYPGKYNVGLIVETTFGCRDTIEISEYINVGGPYAEFNLENDTACVGELVSFNLDSVINTFRLDWDFGDGIGVQLPGNEKSSTHIFRAPGTYSVRILLNDSAFDCIRSVEDTIKVFEVIADMVVSDTSGCAPHEAEFADVSQHADSRRWIHSGNVVSSDSIEQISFLNPGFQKVFLVAIDSKTGCTDTTSQAFEIFPSPEIKISNDTVLCRGDSLLLRATGASFYQWTPREGLSSISDSIVFASPEDDIVYSVFARNDFDCTAEASIEVKVQQAYVFSTEEDTSIFIGQSVPIAIESPDSSLLYRWNPVNDLSCNLCPNPIASPLKTTRYTASISDPFGCFMATASILINVEEEFEVSVPNAFTPNADGLNDWFYAVTYGIKELLYFRVYDRWGKMIFETNSFNNKWNGTVGEVPCPIGTYVWEFEGLRYNDQSVNLVGTINLIR